MDVLLVGVDRASHDALWKSLNADDSIGVIELVMQGNVISVKRATACRVIHINSAWGGLLEVRLLDGENALQTVIVNVQLVQVDKSP